MAKWPQKRGDCTVTGMGSRGSMASCSQFTAPCFDGGVGMSHLNGKNLSSILVRSEWDVNGFPGWWWLEPWNFRTFHILGLSSSQLTNSYFQRGRSSTNQFSDVLISIDIPWWSYNSQVASHQLMSHLIGGLADGTSGWSFSRSNQIIYLFCCWNRSTQHARVWIRLGVPMTHNIYWLYKYFLY